jgi:prevent-host-death family protein
MERIGIRGLRQHASRYVERVKRGETVEVTERGRLVAMLVPPQPARAARERLVAAGQLVPAAEPLRLPRRVKADVSTDDALTELRSDR